MEGGPIIFIPRSLTYQGQPPREMMSTRIIFRPCPHTQWHLKVTFFWDLVPGENATEKMRRIRALCPVIEFGRIVGLLLRDTVTELIFSLDDHWDGSLASEALPLKENASDATTTAEFVLGHRIYVREDPERFLFPRYDGPTTRCRLSQIVIVEELERAVDLVRARLGGDDEERLYVYKRIDRFPLYDPIDTECIEQEIKNLERLPASDFVVRLVSVVLSPNPYRTYQPRQEEEARDRRDHQESPADSPDDMVLRGFLVDYYPNGTLEKALERPPDPNRRRHHPWRWALQFARGLYHLHNHGIAHADLKLCNLVLGAQDNLVVIDVGGIGTTHKWLSPEMIEAINGGHRTRDVPHAIRVQHDIWAFGKIVLEMLPCCEDKEEKALLQSIGQQATAPATHRIALDTIITLLQGRRT